MRLLGAMAMTVLALAACRPEPSPEYAREIEAWRAARLERLRAPDGWLSLVGLEWVGAGPHRIGSGDDCDVRLPQAAPALVATLVIGGRGAELTSGPGVTLLRGGEAFVAGPIEDDARGTPTVLQVGSIRFYLIARSGRLAVRIKDERSSVRLGFAGLAYYPIDPRWRLAARFLPYDEPKVVAVPTVLGRASEEKSPGEVEIALEGRSYRLQALEAEDGGLFLVFGDATNGKETYGAGRFLETEAPRPDGSVVVDFNRAYNPPCAFTPYATCPLPPARNRLSVPVRAGERGAAHH